MKREQMTNRVNVGISAHISLEGDLERYTVSLLEEERYPFMGKDYTIEEICQFRGTTIYIDVSFVELGDAGGVNYLTKLHRLARDNSSTVIFIDDRGRVRSYLERFSAFKELHFQAHPTPK